MYIYVHLPYAKIRFDRKIQLKTLCYIWCICQFKQNYLILKEIIEDLTYFKVNIEYVMKSWNTIFGIPNLWVASQWSIATFVAHSLK